MSNIGLVQIEGLAPLKTEERKKAFADELWTKYHAKRLEVDFTPGGLGSALKASPEAQVAAWDGGALPVKDFVAGLDVRALASLPPEQVPERIDHVLWESVNEKLALLEAHARQYGKVPEVATPVTRYREELMEGAWMVSPSNSALGKGVDHWGCDGHWI